MEKEIQNGIEEFLHGLNRGAKARPMANSRQVSDGFAASLSKADKATQAEVDAFRQTATLLHQLQAPSDIPEQTAGFYARVMERIEAERASNSFWSIFLNPQFSRRLVFASAALLMLLGVTFYATDVDNGLFGTAAPELVESQPLTVQEDFAVPSANQPIEAGLVSHNEVSHDQMLLELTSYQQ